MRMVKVVQAAAAAAAVTLLMPATGLADAAPPWQPGDAVGAPSGAVKDVFIEHENLSMDLTGLNGFEQGAERANVVASYTLRNDGAQRGVDLVFVTASTDVTGGEVTFDGQQVTGVSGPMGSAPPSWMPPAGTPPLSSGPDIPYEVDRPVAITFHIELGQGLHQLRTRYRALPAQYSGDATAYEPHYWQLAFVLSPARQWEGFGSLDVRIQVPAGWSAAVRPGLTRQGDVFSGSFSGIPSDAIAVTTRMPLGYDQTRTGWIIGLTALIVLALLLGFVAGRAGWQLMVISLLVFAPTLAVVLAGFVGTVAAVGHYAIPPAQQSWFGAKGVPFIWVWETTKALFVGIVVSGICILAGSWPGHLAGRTRKARQE